LREEREKTSSGQVVAVSRCARQNCLVVMNINTMTFAARDFSARRGASDAHIPKWICKERATKSGRKRTAALRVAPNLAGGSVARRSQIHFGICSLLAPCHRPNWAQRTSSYLLIGVLSLGKRR